jgi:hypothetical protein
LNVSRLPPSQPSPCRGKEQFTRASRCARTPPRRRINESKAVKDFAFDTWTGYFVRKDTPEPVVEALNKALATAMNDPEARGKLENLGGRVPPMMSVAEAQKEYEKQTARFRAIAKSIKLEAQ